MQVHQITQISESHCGAAVLQMLLDALGVTTSQQEIAEKAGVNETIAEHGMRVDQIAIACNRIAPHLTFWYKYYASLDDIQYLLNHNIPLGVEWQGLFYDSIEQEAEEDRGEGEHGHYSVIAFFDEEQRQLVIVDPYKDFVNRNRIFSADTFLHRWWDTNEVTDPHTGRSQIVEDRQLLFFVTQSDVELPIEMGFKRFNIVQEDRTY
jgi:ABC-type bacteriocin/lantibiotic exporter with double-glycine peptidase domain